MARTARPRQVTIKRYYTPAGKRCDKSTPGAIPRKEKSKTWYWCRPRGSKPRRVPLGKDEGQAWAKLRELLRKDAERKAGLRDDTTDHLALPIHEHVEQWVGYLRAKGKAGTKQLSMLAMRVNTVAFEAGWKTLSDVSAESCLKALAALQKPFAEGGRNLSAQTRNHYLSACKQFTRWSSLSRPKRLREDPLNDLEPVSVEEDRRHDRRCPTDQEVTLLFAWLDANNVVRVRLTSGQRAMGYKVCMATGFRAKELRALTAASFDLDGGTVTGSAAYAKGGKKSIQPLPPWLVDELRAYFAAGGCDWSGWPAVHPGRLLRSDLEAAGVSYAIVGPEGHNLFFDFHALRHWYITQVANQPGISPKDLMQLARHSDPRLTLRIYAKVRTESLHRAAAQIPRPGQPS